MHRVVSHRADHLSSKVGYLRDALLVGNVLIVADHLRRADRLHEQLRELTLVLKGNGKWMDTWWFGWVMVVKVKLVVKVIGQINL